MRTKSRAVLGITMVELATVMAIIAILATLAAGSFQQMSARTGSMNASSEFGSALSIAKARATQTGNDVWVVVYPKGGPPGKQRGAWYVFEDRDGAFGDFDSSPGAFNYRDHFSPTNLTSGSTQGRLLSSQLLYDLSKIHVEFGYAGQIQFRPPFASLNSTNRDQVTCSFCTPAALDATSRGAVVFRGDGSVQLYDGAANPLTARRASMAIQSGDRSRAYLFAISTATGYTAILSR